MMRIMLVDESAERSLCLRLALERLGYEIVAEVSNPRQLYDDVTRYAPDAIIIDTESPSRDTLEHLCMVTGSCPRPIVMFTQDAKRESIREAVRAGVTAYVVDGMAPERIQPIIEAALARFEAFQSVQLELAQTRSQLSERKVVERAKGILMADRKMSEDQAYHALRKLAMDRGASIGAVAGQVIAISKLFT
jgi:response regulator NasT